MPPAELGQFAAPVSADPLAEYLSECKALVLGEIKHIISDAGEFGEILYNLMLDYPLRDAKGLRPTLSIASCRALGGNVDAVLRSATVLELYHNAFLIHDDVEDQSTVRRGQPTLHRLHGVPVAVNVGDAMLCLSLQPLLDNMSVIGLGASLRILRAVAKMTRESVEGQALELDWMKRGAWNLSDQDYVRMVEKKTGWYSFITPLVVGGIAASAPADCLDALADFGRCLGTAFQIQDDVLSLRGEPESFGKEIGGDLWEGKRTLILLHMMRQASRAERAEVERILALPLPPSTTGRRGQRHRRTSQILREMTAAGELTAAGYQRLRRLDQDDSPARCKTRTDVRRLFELVHKYDSIDYASRIAQQWADRAQTVFDTTVARWMPRSVHRDVLQAIVDYVHHRRR